MKTSDIGIMLLGSVPTPPKKPRSSMSTQSARQRTIPAMTATRITAGRPLKNAIPSTARAITRKRFTAQPCAASKAPKLATHDARRLGWGVCDIWCTIAVSVPGLELGCSWPCQKPRPGQACSTAMPTKKRPITERIARPSRGLVQSSVGEGDEHAGEAVEEDGARRSESPGQARGEDAPEALAEDPDDDPPKGARETGQARPVPAWRRRAARRRFRPESRPPRPAP